MVINKITLEEVNIALKTPFKTALREVKNASFVRLKIFCSDGCFAYGEAPATEAITGETLQSIRRDIGQIAPLLYGFSPQESLEKLHATMIGSSAKAAVDMALFALLAQQKNQTLAEAFGIQDFSSRETDITISLNAQQQMLDDAKKALREGMQILKVKLGSDIAHAIAVTKILAQECAEATLLIDANQAWSKEESLEYLKAVRGCDIALVEQPVKASALEDLQLLTQASNIPILADESVFTLEDAKRIIEDRAADMINIKLMKCGGVTKAIEILEYAQTKKIGCMLGSMIEGPFSINIAIYLAFAYRDVVQYIDLDSPLLYKEFPKELDFVYDKATISFKVHSLV